MHETFVRLSSILRCLQEMGSILEGLDGVDHYPILYSRLDLSSQQYKNVI